MENDIQRARNLILASKYVVLEEVDNQQPTTRRDRTEWVSSAGFDR